jgi:MSHA pilin protein MshD
MRIATPACERARGFTLVEIVVALVIVSIAAAAVMQALSFGLQRQSDPLWQAKAVALGEAYLDEVLARRYDTASPPGGVPPCSPLATPCSDGASFGGDPADRAQFESVSDYHGLVDEPPRDAEGNVRAGYESFRVEIAVRYVDTDERDALGLDDVTDAKHVEVRVTDRGTPTLVFSAYRGNF